MKTINLAIIAAMSAMAVSAGVSEAKVVAGFPGNAYIYPIYLTNEKCQSFDKSWHRSIAHAHLLNRPNGVIFEGCWKMDDSGQYQDNTVVRACLKKGNDMYATKMDDCKYISINHFDVF